LELEGEGYMAEKKDTYVAEREEDVELEEEGFMAGKKYT
jgi:hypothetical protein